MRGASSRAAMPRGSPSSYVRPPLRTSHRAPLADLNAVLQGHDMHAEAVMHAILHLWRGACVRAWH